MVHFLPSIVAAGGPGLSSLQVGLLIAIPWICAAIGAIVIPRLAERDLKPKRWMLISTAGMFVGLLIAVFGSPWVAFGGYCLVELCFIAPQPLYFAHVGSRLQGAMLAAGLTAVNTCRQRATWVCRTTPFWAIACWRALPSTVATWTNASVC